MEVIRQRGLSYLMKHITDRRFREYYSIVTRQRALEILYELTSEKNVLTILQQNHLFLFHVKKLRMSSSEQGFQLAADALIHKLETYENSINTTEQEKKDLNISDDLAIINEYNIFISYSSVDRDICYQISDQLIRDNFRVKIGLDFIHESTIQSNTNAIEYRKVKRTQCGYINVK